jgi:hypothetical protein
MDFTSMYSVNLGSNTISEVKCTVHCMTKTKRTLRLFYIISLFLSPLIGLLTILIFSYCYILKNIDWSKQGFKINIHPKE